MYFGCKWESWSQGADVKCSTYQYIKQEGCPATTANKLCKQLNITSMNMTISIEFSNRKQFEKAHICGEKNKTYIDGGT